MKYSPLVALLFSAACFTTLRAVETADSVSILLGGDTSYGENYQERYAREGGVNILATQGYDYSLAKLNPLLSKCDLVIVNLETPLTSVRESPIEGKSYYHFSDPSTAAAALHDHHVDAVSLANNHTLDFGEAGLEETLRSLQKNDIDCFGAGMDYSAAAAPLVKEFEIGDDVFELVVFGAFESRTTYEEYDFYADGDQAGTLRLDPADLARRIGEVRRSRPSAFVVIFPHWGRNYQWRSRGQQDMARKLIDAGADLIVGHGAHCLQEVEKYKGRWIIYSIGNFMFNSRGRFSRLSAPPYSISLVLDVRQKGNKLSKSIRFYPIVSDNKKTNYQPRPVNKEEFRDVCRLLKDHSEDTDLAALMKLDSNDFGNYIELTVSD